MQVQENYATKKDHHFMKYWSGEYFLSIDKVYILSSHSRFGDN